MEICTIGFTKHAAATFFGTLKDEGIEQLVDVRLANTSHLAGFAKRDDLRFFLKEICDAEYFHEPDLLAPTEELRTAFGKGDRKGDISWIEYEKRFLELMAERRIEEKLSSDFFEPRTVLLCSEHLPNHCHRRLVLEYLSECWPDLTALHLPREQRSETANA